MEDGINLGFPLLSLSEVFSTYLCTLLTPVIHNMLLAIVLCNVGLFPKSWIKSIVTRNSRSGSGCSRGAQGMANQV